MTILLGFAIKLETTTTTLAEEVEELEEESAFCPPPSKIGGKPDWLKNAQEPVACLKCSCLMKLLLQIFTNEDQPPAQALHRMMYLYICPANHSVRVFRSQIERLGRQPNEHRCHICASLSKGLCGKCHAVAYCSHQHQSLDWPCHKYACTGKSNLALTFPAPRHMLPEFEICCEQEPSGNMISMSACTLQEGTDYEMMNEAIQGGHDDDEDLNEPETETGVDEAFLKFQKRIEREPDQILRYYRNDDSTSLNPLYAYTVDKPLVIPNCELCSGPRTLEFQVMPQILSYVGQDHLDFGTLIIYSCNANCEIDGYAEEIAVKQDFTQDGMQNLRKIEQRNTEN